jgi:dTDP-4-amino-4,6-dideoxygalactose transaminase
LFPVRIHADAKLDRDEIIQLLTSHGIGTSVHYRPLHLMSYWSRNACSDGAVFPVADAYFAGALTLPLFPGMTTAQVDEVADILRAALE